MSFVTNVYNFVGTQVSTALPNHREMSNAYFPDLEYEAVYDQSYGIGVADAQINQVQNYIFDITRVFIISITRRVYGVKGDANKRKTVEKSLYEDQYLVIKQLLSSVKGGVQNNFVKDLRFLRDGGIEFLRTEREDILILRSEVELRYHEEV